MITDKEYPATHSMATAWYMVDADGNVGLIAFDDNGPVPKSNHVEPDLGLVDLVFGQGLSSDETCKGIHLNVSQLHELLGQPRKPDDVKLWDVCLAVAPEYTSKFLYLCENEDITNYGCISAEMNLYFVDVYDCIDSSGNIIKGSTLDKMINGNMIRAIYQMPALDVISEYDKDTESVVFSKNYDNTPYYVYCQSYWTSDPQHRMNVPSNPVNIAQVDEAFRGKMLHVPVRFKDAEDLQIAQWFVCNSNAPELVIDNAGYSLFPIDKHTDIYCLTSPFLFDFYEYCPEMGYYKCAKCNHDCASTVKIIESSTPTVLYIADPAEKSIHSNLRDLPQEIRESLAVFSYIPKFPHKESRSWMRIEDLQKYMTTEALTSLLSYSRGWIENVVRIINPQVIIIDNEALPVFTAVFPVADNEVKIADTTYPIFDISSVKDNCGHIVSLSQLPYRGCVFRKTYSETEVCDLKQRGIL